MSGAIGRSASISSYESCKKPVRFYSKLLFLSLGDPGYSGLCLSVKSEEEKIQTRFSLHSSGDRFGT